MEHRSWMAFAQWVEATTNQTMVSAVGGGVERRCERVERVGEDVYSSFWVTNRATKKMKIERAIGPRISMAPAAWDDAKTNQKVTPLLGYIWKRRRAGL